MFEPIREKGDDERENKGSGPGRDGVQLCADLSVAVCFNDAGSEESVAIGGDNESEVHESAEEEFVIFEAIHYIGKGDSALARGATLIFEEAGADVGTFVFAEPVGERGQWDVVIGGLGRSLPFRFLWEVGDHKIECKCYYA